MSTPEKQTFSQIKPQRFDDETEETNTYLVDTFFKKFTFDWVTKLIKMNRVKTFEQNMHYSLRSSEQSATNYNAMDREWQLLKDSNKSYLVLRTIIRAYSKQFVMLIGLAALRVVLFFCNPLIINLMMKLVSQENPSTYHVVGLLAFIPFIKILMVIVDSHSKFALEVVGMSLKYGLVGLIYSKAMKISIIKGKEHSVGSIVNNYEIDCEKLREMMGALQNLVVTPIQMLIGIVVLCFLAGFGSVGGIVIMLIVCYLSFIINKNYSRLQEIIMNRKDTRMKLLNEVLNGIKYIKMSGWEESFIRKIGATRVKELDSLKERAKYSIIWMVNYLVGAQGGLVATVACYILFGSSFDVTKMITLCSIFWMLTASFSQIPQILTVMADSAISMRRIQKLLLSEELDRSYIRQVEQSDDPIAIEISQGNFSWRPASLENPADDEFPAPNSEPFEKVPQTIELTTEGGHSLEQNHQALELMSPKSESQEKDDYFRLENINLKISRGSFVAIIGDVGCGKSSLFYSLVGEMTTRKSSPPDVRINGSLAYLPQKPWIINATLRENILFGQPYDKERFDRVISFSAMESDLTMLDHGELTEIGEKGINLSGGQKARVSLARALYSQPDIFLLDDVLSAVDVHVGTHIIEKCLLKYVADKTRVLITHNLDYLKYVDYIYMMENGRIIHEGTLEALKTTAKFNELLNKTHTQTEESKTSTIDGIEDDEGGEDTKHRQKKDIEHQPKESNEIEIVSDEKSKTKTDEIIQSLIIAEDREKGRIKGSTFRTFYRMWGGGKYFYVILIVAILKEFCIHGSSPFLAYWGNNPSLLSVSKFLTIFILLSFGSLFFQAVVFGMSYARTYTCSSQLHVDMVRSILQAPLNLFFDRVPTGRILNRFSGDVERIDTGMPWSIAHFTASVILLTITLTICVTFSNFMTIIPMLGFLKLCHIFYQSYTSINREVLRLKSISNSPIVSHLTETLQGLSVIRSFRQESRFFASQMAKMDESIKNQLVSCAASQWYNVRCSFGSVVVLIPISLVTLVWKDYIGMSPALSGVVTSFLLGSSGNMTWFLWELAELEARFISFERCHKFTEVESEKIEPEKKHHTPTDNWPQEGRITFKNYSTRYRPGLPLVLKGLNLTIQPGEKVGVIGRTGSGKSSLMLSLLRIIEASEGSILIDDISIDSVSLPSLRDKITVIAQDPQLFEGTLRENVDVLGRYSDEEVKKALDMANLSNLYDSTEGLDKEIKSGGENLSAGERQMICIARALLKHNKVVLIDEATSNIDMNNEEIFLKTVKERFKDCTVLTVAHRLNTIINSDKIIVMSEGKFVEVGDPKELLQREDSIFGKMWNEAKRMKNKTVERD